MFYFSRVTVVTRVRISFVTLTTSGNLTSRMLLSLHFLEGGKDIFVTGFLVLGSHPHHFLVLQALSVVLMGVSLKETQEQKSNSMLPTKLQPLGPWVVS